MRILVLLLAAALLAQPTGEILHMAGPCRIPKGGSGLLNITIENVLDAPMEGVVLEFRPYARAYVSPIHGLIIVGGGPFPEIPRVVEVGNVPSRAVVRIPVRAGDASQGSYLVAVRMTFSSSERNYTLASPGWFPERVFRSAVVDGEVNLEKLGVDGLIPDLLVSVTSSTWPKIRYALLALLVSAYIALSLRPPRKKVKYVRYRCERGHVFYHKRGLERCPVCGSKITPSGSSGSPSSGPPGSSSRRRSPSSP